MAWKEIIYKSILVIYWDMAMDQYLLIPFLVGWTSIYQLFWCSPGVQGFDPLPYLWVRYFVIIYRHPEVDRTWIVQSSLHDMNMIGISIFHLLQDDLFVIGWVGFSHVNPPITILVGGIPTPLKHISQLGLFFPIYGKIKNVWNHQPVS